jgi:ABC-2 type transport system permease protein
VRQLARDRVTFGMIVGVPLMQIMLFGYAINFDVRHLAPSCRMRRTLRCRAS